MNPNLLGIAGTESGSGKTLVTMGYIRAFQHEGLDVQSFKVGPDFIDPLYHRAVTERPSVNLDRFFMAESGVRTLVDAYWDGADVGLIEGVMGLYDGKAGEPGQYSTAELYRELDVPYVLVVNAAGQSHSIAAKVRGFLDFDPELDCLGLVLTRVASDRHESMLTRSLQESVDPPVLGCIRDRESLRVPSRHLGLDTAFLFDNPAPLETAIDEDVSSNLTLPETILDRSTTGRSTGKSVFDCDAEFEVTVGVASDDAFHFYYDYNLRLLREMGAEIRTISPLRDDGLPGDLDGVYLGGGYPEQFAEELEANENFVLELRAALESGLPVIAECGGFIYLSEALIDRQNQSHDMVGWFETTVTRNDTFSALGYVEGEARESHPFFETGKSLRGHEFHYSDCSVPETFVPAVSLEEGRGLKDGGSGMVKGNVLGSYVHWHFGSAHGLARGFLTECSRRCVKYA